MRRTLAQEIEVALDEALDLRKRLRVLAERADVSERVYLLLEETPSLAERIADDLSAAMRVEEEERRHGPTVERRET
jgi:hypothetical protein